MLSPASRFQPKTAPLPLPPHGPSFGVPKGAHVQANALAEVSQIGRGREQAGREISQESCREHQREGEAAPKSLGAKRCSHCAPVPCSSPCSSSTGARAQRNKIIFVLGQNGAPCPQNGPGHCWSRLQAGAEGHGATLGGCTGSSHMMLSLQYHTAKAGFNPGEG